jgi:hypothetical protein
MFPPAFVISKFAIAHLAYQYNMTEFSTHQQCKNKTSLIPHYASVFLAVLIDTNIVILTKTVCN